MPSASRRQRFKSLCRLPADGIVGHMVASQYCLAELFAVRWQTAKSAIKPLTALTPPHCRPLSLPSAVLGWRTAKSFAVRFQVADDKEGLCWHVFRRTVCRLLADGKELCHQLADGKHATCQPPMQPGAVGWLISSFVVCQLTAKNVSSLPSAS